MKTQVRNLDGKVVKELDLPEAVFGFPFKEHLVHTAVTAHRADQRRGTHKVKGRGEVRGSTRKPPTSRA